MFRMVARRGWGHGKPMSGFHPHEDGLGLESLTLHWPSPETLLRLEAVSLLPLWLERELERLVSQRQPFASWRHRCFRSGVASLFLQRRCELERLDLSLLRLADPHLAQECWFRLHSGEADFWQLRPMTDDPHQRVALFDVRVGELDPALRQLLQPLPPAALAAPLAQEDGSVLLIRVDRRWPAVLDAAMHEELEQQLYTQWLASVMDPLLHQPPQAEALVTIPLPVPA